MKLREYKVTQLRKIRNFSSTRSSVHKMHLLSCMSSQIPSSPLNQRHYLLLTYFCLYKYSLFNLILYILIGNGYVSPTYGTTCTYAQGTKKNNNSCY